MLVSDILHNSSAPVKNASAFRTKFEASLPNVMESFNDLYRGITGRITAEALKVTYIVPFVDYVGLLFVHDILMQLLLLFCRRGLLKFYKCGRTGFYFLMHI
jgi:hypothetical protein